MCASDMRTNWRSLVKNLSCSWIHSTKGFAFCSKGRCTRMPMLLPLRSGLTRLCSLVGRLHQAWPTTRGNIEVNVPQLRNRLPDFFVNPVSGLCAS